MKTKTDNPREEENKLPTDNGSDAETCSVCCANCQFGAELQERYDQVYCVNGESQEYQGNVEATWSCSLFLPNVKLTSSDNTQKQ